MKKNASDPFSGAEEDKDSTKNETLLKTEDLSGEMRPGNFGAGSGKVSQCSSPDLDRPLYIDEANDQAPSNCQSGESSNDTGACRDGDLKSTQNQWHNSQEKPRNSSHARETSYIPIKTQNMGIVNIEGKFKARIYSSESLSSQFDGTKQANVHFAKPRPVKGTSRRKSTPTHIPQTDERKHHPQNYCEAQVSNRVETSQSSAQRNDLSECQQKQMFLFHKKQGWPQLHEFSGPLPSQGSQDIKTQQYDNQSSSKSLFQNKQTVYQLQVDRLPEKKHDHALKLIQDSQNHFNQSESNENPNNASCHLQFQNKMTVSSKRLNSSIDKTDEIPTECGRSNIDLNEHSLIQSHKTDPNPSHLIAKKAPYVTEQRQRPLSKKLKQEKRSPSKKFKPQDGVSNIERFHDNRTIPDTTQQKSNRFNPEFSNHYLQAAFNSFCQKSEQNQGTIYDRLMQEVQALTDIINSQTTKLSETGNYGVWNQSSPNRNLLQSTKLEHPNTHKTQKVDKKSAKRYRNNSLMSKENDESAKKKSVNSLSFDKVGSQSAYTLGDQTYFGAQTASHGHQYGPHLPHLPFNSLLQNPNMEYAFGDQKIDQEDILLPENLHRNQPINFVENQSSSSLYHTGTNCKRLAHPQQNIPSLTVPSTHIPMSQAARNQSNWMQSLIQNSASQHPEITRQVSKGFNAPKFDNQQQRHVNLSQGGDMSMNYWQLQPAYFPQRNPAHASGDTAIQSIAASNCPNPCQSGYSLSSQQTPAGTIRKEVLQCAPRTSTNAQVVQNNSSKLPVFGEDLIGILNLYCQYTNRETLVAMFSEDAVRMWEIWHALSPCAAKEHSAAKEHMRRPGADAHLQVREECNRTVQPSNLPVASNTYMHGAGAVPQPFQQPEEMLQYSNYLANNLKRSKDQERRNVANAAVHVKSNTHSRSIQTRVRHVEQTKFLQPPTPTLASAIPPLKVPETQTKKESNSNVLSKTQWNVRYVQNRRSTPNTLNKVSANTPRMSRSGDGAETHGLNLNFTGNQDRTENKIPSSIGGVLDLSTCNRDRTEQKEK